MPARTAQAEWRGDLRGGNGRVRTGSGAIDRDYSFVSRFEDGSGTNPEELLAAAHAACFSMALSHGLAQAGHAPTRVATTARAYLDKVADGFAVTRIELECEAEVPGIAEDEFRSQADAAKTGCPISKALAATEIRLTARLVGG
ncbi:OsmC family peroxiredoxin [Arenibaculum sp.]|jgi:osmotically inducible protein OsmC|uniref:OsmC family peroxiredoxin n=1 Tax=Arenibaculum sp. TaxID=2865862 RepID=UPI002E0F5763|nr:OsmC family peroxiredoxin [Arenibaculum sp.]